MGTELPSRASPASLASTSLRGPRVMAPASPALPPGRVCAGPVPQPSPPPRWRWRPSAEGRASGLPGKLRAHIPARQPHEEGRGHLPHPGGAGAGAGLDEGTSCASHWVPSAPSFRPLLSLPIFQARFIVTCIVIKIHFNY